MTLFQLLILMISISYSLCQNEKYSEELVIKSLESGRKLSATFRLSTISPPPKDDYELFPRALGLIMNSYSLIELQVSLTRGVWRDALWGFSPFPSPIGASVLAWFSSNVTNVDESWKGLVNALSGQFCASLNFMDLASTTSPLFSFQPQGVLLNTSASLKFGYLPGENVCTENLTPWKKLLPCSSKRGLSTLLNPRSIQDTSYFSLGISIRSVCKDSSCRTSLLELTHHLLLVFDLKGKETWSIRSLFGIGLNSICPLASFTSLIIETADGLQMSSRDLGHVLKDRISYNVSFLHERGIHNLIGTYSHSKVPLLKSSSSSSLSLSSSQPLITATRYISGYGQEKGGIVTRITNIDSKPLPIVFLDIIPWYLRLYLHTLKIETNIGEKIEIKNLSFTPGRDRIRPYSLELVLSLPPKSTTRISIDFERSLLKWSEYPPDANKGFFVGSALISTLLPNSNSVFQNESQKYPLSFFESPYKNRTLLIRIFTESLLVLLPTPDFSMPYNTICLTTTIFAMAFGPLYGITTKKLTLGYKQGFFLSLLSSIKNFYHSKKSGKTKG